MLAVEAALGVLQEHLEPGEAGHTGDKLEGLMKAGLGGLNIEVKGAEDGLQHPATVVTEEEGRGGQGLFAAPEDADGNLESLDEVANQHPGVHPEGYSLGKGEDLALVHGLCYLEIPGEVLAGKGGKQGLWGEGEGRLMHLGLWGGLLDVQHELLADLGLAGELPEVGPLQQ